MPQNLSNSLNDRHFLRVFLSFQHLGKLLEFPNQPVSVFGTSGLNTSVLHAAGMTPSQLAGLTVSVRLEALDAQYKPYQVSAVILQERSERGESAGLRFEFTEEERNRIVKEISEKGFSPSDTVRKYPRLPVKTEISTFPLLVQVTPQDFLIADETYPISMALVNLSPNGALLSSENALSKKLDPGQRFRLTLEPRGWFTSKIEVTALLCRVTDDWRKETQSTLRYFGMKFVKIDDQNRDRFLTLWRELLIQKSDESTER